MLFADTVMDSPELLPKTRQHKVTDEDLADVGEGSSLVGVKEHLTYTVHDLWLGVFLRSGNDAVHVLSAMYGGVPRTVAAMQAHAEELQALDTNVVSPDGYDAPEQVSSAYDLTLFARSGLQKEDFREYCSTATADFPGEKKKGKKRGTFEIQNTDRLLTGADGVEPYKGIAGVKNGYTTHAGNTFTGVAERNGKVLLVTVMNPSSKEPHAVYKEAASLLDWGFDAAGKVTPVGELVPPKSAQTGTGKGTESANGNSASGASGSGSEDAGKHGPAATGAAATKGSSGVGIALGIVGGVLVLLAGGVFLVNRRWPLPDLVRRLLAADVRDARPDVLAARRRRPGGAEQQQPRREVDPQQEGDRHTEGAVHALRRDTLHIAAEQQLEEFEADRADHRRCEQPAPRWLHARQQCQQIEQQQEIGHSRHEQGHGLQQRSARAMVGDAQEAAWSSRPRWSPPWKRQG